MAIKNGVNWGKLQSVTLTLELSLKMSYFPDYYEESFTFDILKTDTSINWKARVFKNFFYRRVRRAIKLTISARDAHFVVTRFSNKQAYLFMCYFTCQHKKQYQFCQFLPDL